MGVLRDENRKLEDKNVMLNSKIAKLRVSAKTKAKDSIAGLKKHN